MKTEFIQTNVIWPETFTSGVVNCGKEVSDQLSLIADALSAWGSAHMAKTPENFGEIMAEIGSCLGVTPTPDVLM